MPTTNESSQTIQSSNETRKYIVMLKSDSDKAAHLDWLSSFASNNVDGGSNIKVEKKDGWNSDFIKGYVAELDSKTFEAVKAHKDVHIIEEEKFGSVGV